MRKEGMLIFDLPKCCITPEGKVCCPLAWNTNFCTSLSPKGVTMTGADWEKIYASGKRPYWCPIRQI